MHTIIYKLDNHKGPTVLYNTRNYTQYFIITYKGKECENVYIYMNHCAIYLKLTWYCKLTILQLKIKKNKTITMLAYKILKLIV